MPTTKLSPREEEIVELCVDGLTNEAIAIKLGLSVGTVNTYWLRIKLKVGGHGRSDTVAKIVKGRAELVLSQEKLDWKGLEDILAQREISNLTVETERRMELYVTLSLLNLALTKFQSTVWTTDSDLVIQVIANGELCSPRFGVTWENGKTVYELFKTSDKANPAVAAHLGALAGSESEQRLTGDFANMTLSVLPLNDEHGDAMGCVGILSCDAEDVGSDTPPGALPAP